MASGDARPVPKKNAAYRVTFPIFDADGDLVTAAGSLDSERSLDGGTFADCSNEATEIATSSGMYYLDLNASEMNADTVALIVKSSGGKTTPIVLYPVLGAFKEIYSDTTIIESDTAVIESESTVIQSDVAAVESELIVVHSETTVIQTDADNIYSDTAIIEAWGLGSAASDAAAIESELIVVHSDTLAIETDTGNIYSDTAIIEAWGLGSAASDAAAIESELIVVHSEATVIQSDAAVIEGYSRNAGMSTVRWLPTCSSASWSPVCFQSQFRQTASSATSGAGGSGRS